MDVLAVIEAEVRAALQSNGLLTYLTDESQFLNPGFYSVQLVLSDGNKIDQTVEVVFHLQAQLEVQRKITFEFSVRAKWALLEIGVGEELRTSDGAITAAAVVPVELISGTRKTTVRVIVTWEASETLKRLLRREFSLREVAETTSIDMLRRSGSSAWDPIQQPTIQINSSAALYVSSLLRKAA